jgi:CheY-like chemotaxis protein
VTQAGSGQSAAEQFKSLAALDLVITDQFMDDGDGWRVLQAADVEWPGVPVLLASAAPPSPPLNYPEHLRFSAHFLRPLDYEQLLRRVGDLLELTWSATPTWTHRDDEAEVKPQVNAISSRPIQRPDDNESIAYPSETDLRALATLVETGQVTAIKEWAIALKAGQPEFASFSERVFAATKTLDMEALRALAHRMESTCEK